MGYGLKRFFVFISLITPSHVFGNDITLNFILNSSNFFEASNAISTSEPEANIDAS